MYFKRTECVFWTLIFVINFFFLPYSLSLESRINPDEIHRESLKNIRSSASEETQAAAALDVIFRLLPEVADQIEISVDFFMPKNSFNVTSHSSIIKIKGSSGVAVTRGFYQILQEIGSADANVAWEGIHLNHNVNETLAWVGGFDHVGDSEFIYYQNVCTWSYSFPWWTLDDWVRHIDWIALHGINLVLAPFQEDVWLEIYRELHLSEEEIKEHLTGPAFSAWNRMGNLRGWGGPIKLPIYSNEAVYIRKASNLQKHVIQKLQDLGISIAVPSFAGHVPVAFQRIFPNNSFRNITWLNFDVRYSGALFLDPTDPLFATVGTKFLSKIIDRYGSNHLYFADPFNEMTPSFNSTNYIKSVSEAIFNVMKSVDEHAVWLLQGWVFQNEPQFWQDSQIKAFLTAVPQGRILVLDLYAEKKPQYIRTHSFYGQPFIWCMLHNFGGNLGMHGSAAQIQDNLTQAKQDKALTMVGIGITPEGINQNHVMYEYVLTLAWFKKADARSWFKKTAMLRYGRDGMNPDLLDAWILLYSTVYNRNGTAHIGGSSHALIVDSPSLKHSPWSWFSISSIEKVLSYFLSGSAYNYKNKELLVYDLVDTTRQYLQNLADYHYLLIQDGYALGSAEKVKYHAKLFLGIVCDMDDILATNKNFLLANWFKAAMEYNEDGQDEKKSYIIPRGACNQITLWGPKGEISNYGMKQWAGLMKDYVHKRWKSFLAVLIKSMEDNTVFDETAVKKDIFLNVERRFCEKPYPFDKYSPNATGDSYVIAREIYNRYSILPRNFEILAKYIKDD